MLHAMVVKVNVSVAFAHSGNVSRAVDVNVVVTLATVALAPPTIAVAVVITMKVCTPPCQSPGRGTHSPLRATHSPRPSGLPRRENPRYTPGSARSRVLHLPGGSTNSFVSRKYLSVLTSGVNCSLAGICTHAHGRFNQEI